LEEKQYHNKLLSLTAHLKIVINFLEFVYSTEILSDLRLKDFEMISPQNISRLESSRKELRKLYKEFVDKIINILLNYSSTKTIVRTNITRENIMKFLKFYNNLEVLERMRSLFLKENLSQDMREDLMEIINGLKLLFKNPKDKWFENLINRINKLRIYNEVALMKIMYIS